MRRAAPALRSHEGPLLPSLVARKHPSTWRGRHVKFFLPDSQDLVDPSFDFENEQRSKDRRRQRHDLYAHEVFSQPAFDGFLVSKGMVDGFGALGSRYTLSQRLRLSQMGAP
ncbi:conserved hypothetical protein, partial [Stigmatella aurantiaca DW4/3-1]